MVPDPIICPCHSGAKYADCCRAFHLGEREAETPEQLMRSRYSAYALHLGAYLVKTLASSHPDKRQRWEPSGKQKFASLRILHTQHDAHLGEVLFYARIYSDGMETSFAELSQFVREDGGWRYSEGVIVEKARLPKDIASLTKAKFLELARL